MKRALPSLLLALLALGSLTGCSSSGDDASAADDEAASAARIAWRFHRTGNMQVLQVTSGDDTTMLAQVSDMADSPQYRLLAFDAASGAEKWTYSYEKGLYPRDVVVHDGNVVVFDTQGKGRRTLRIGDGSVLADDDGFLTSLDQLAWSADGRLVTTGFEVDSGNMIAVVRGYDADGKLAYRWQDPDCFNCDQSFGWSRPVFGPDGTAYVALGSLLRAFDAKGNVLWSSQLGDVGTNVFFDFSFEPDGAFVARGNGTSFVLDATSPIVNGERTPTVLPKNTFFTIPTGGSSYGWVTHQTAYPSYGQSEWMSYTDARGQLGLVAASDRGIASDGLTGPLLGMMPRAAWDGVLVQTTTGVSFRRVDLAAKKETEVWKRPGFFMPLDYVAGDPIVLGLCTQPASNPQTSTRVTLCELNESGTRKWQTTFTWTPFSAPTNALYPRYVSGDAARWSGADLDLVNHAAAHRLYAWSVEAIYAIKTD